MCPCSAAPPRENASRSRPGDRRAPISSRSKKRRQRWQSAPFVCPSPARAAEQRRPDETRRLRRLTTASTPNRGHERWARWSDQASFRAHRDGDKAGVEIEEVAAISSKPRSSLIFLAAACYGPKNGRLPSKPRQNPWGSRDWLVRRSRGSMFVSKNDATC